MRLRVITHTFPPSTHANAKRPCYLVKGFLAAGWEVDVYTHCVGMPAGVGETITHPALRIFRASDPIERLLRWGQAIPGASRALASTLAGVMWPDVYSIWARRLFRSFQGEDGYDRTLAFVLPASVLLAGKYPRLVARSWIFDYQESVTPHFRQMGRRSPLQGYLLPRLEALERDTLRQAGQVVFTANTNRKAYMEAGLLNDVPTEHIPYFYDAAAFADPAMSVLSNFDITYFGGFDWRGARSPGTFLRALAEFLKLVPEARKWTRFVFYGNWLQEHTSLLGTLGLEEVVSINRAVGYEDYIRKLRQSPVLLLVVAPEHNLFMPSKIVDYFGANRPILAFVPEQSEMRQVLGAAGMSEFVLGTEDITGGVAALRQLWSRFKSGELDCDARNTQSWSSEVQLPRYLKLINTPI